MKTLKILEKFLTIIILAAALLVVASFIPIPGNYKLYIVESGSMEPAIKTGSVVVVKPLSTNSGQAAGYKIGDIITFGDKEKGKTTTHRIKDLEVVVGKTYFITKGDANNAEDANKVPEDKVIGKVLADIPYAGYLLAYAKQPLGFVLLVIVPSAIIIFEEIGKIWKEIHPVK